MIAIMEMSLASRGPFTAAPLAPPRFPEVGFEFSYWIGRHVYLSSTNRTVPGVCLSFCTVGIYVPKLRTGTLLPSDAMTPFELASVAL